MRAGTDLDGETGFGAFTALVTVQAVAVGANAGGEGRERQVMVVPLAKEGDHVCVLAIALNTSIIGCQDTVRDLPYLQTQREGEKEDRGRRINTIMLLHT